MGDFVHESVQVEGRVGHLESNLLHFTCDSLSEHLKTMDRYTTLAAQELAARKVKVPLSHVILDPAWTFVQDLFPPARFPGRPGRPDHRLHGGVLHVSEILQSEKHELMRILHLDAGREMRGGQWQVLAADGRAGGGGRGIHAAGARRARRCSKPPRETAAGAWSRWASTRAAMLARGTTWSMRTMRAATRWARSCAARRWWCRGAWRSRSGSRWKYGRARHYLAVSEFVKSVLMAGGVPEEKISVVYDGVPVLELAQPASAVLAPANADDPQKGAPLAMEAARLAGVELDSPPISSATCGAPRSSFTSPTAKGSAPACCWPCRRACR